MALPSPEASEDINSSKDNLINLQLHSSYINNKVICTYKCIYLKFAGLLIIEYNFFIT